MTESIKSQIRWVYFEDIFEDEQFGSKDNKLIKDIKKNGLNPSIPVVPLSVLQNLSFCEKETFKKEKIWRVATIGMNGLNEEMYYSNLEQAEKGFDNLIEKCKKDENTLPDEECRESPWGFKKNFDEKEILNLNKDKKIKDLKSVHWVYSYEIRMQDCSEWDSTVEEITLQEINFEDGGFTKGENSCIESEDENGE